MSSYFNSDPSVALANAQQARGINSLDAWLRAQQQLAGLTNQVSTQRLDRQQGLDREGILNHLAANGLGRSGDVGYLQGQSALNFADKRYDQSANLLSHLSNLMGTYLTKKEGIRDNTTGAYQGAFENAAQNPVPGFQPVKQPRPAAPTRKPAPSFGGASGGSHGGVGLQAPAPTFKPIAAPRGNY